MQMRQRRAATCGDVVEARRAYDPEGRKVTVRLMHAVNTWVWKAEAVQRERIEVLMEGARRVPVATWSKVKVSQAPTAEERWERTVAEAQMAYKAVGDWREGPMISARRDLLGTPVGTQEWREAVAEARRRWANGPVAIRAVTLNHGGMTIRLRETVEASRRLAAEAKSDAARDTPTLVRQADARLYRTMRTLALGNDLVVAQETHLPEDEPELTNQLKGILTTGEFQGWEVHSSPAPNNDRGAGVLMWFNKEKIEVLEPVRTLVKGRVQWARLRVRSDGTEVALLHVYRTS